MKPVVYLNEKPKNEVTRLSLREEGDEVVLRVVDGNGEWVTDILRITAEGTILRHNSVDTDLGFKLDKDEAVVVEKETT